METCMKCNLCKLHSISYRHIYSYVCVSFIVYVNVREVTQFPFYVYIYICVRLNDATPHMQRKLDVATRALLYIACMLSFCVCIARICSLVHSNSIIRFAYFISKENLIISGCTYVCIYVCVLCVHAQDKCKYNVTMCTMYMNLLRIGEFLFFFLVIFYNYTKNVFDIIVTVT